MNIKILHNKYFRLKKSESVYGSILPRFAIGDKAKNTIKAISYFVSCRETLGDGLRHRVNNSSIDTKTLNLLIWFAAPEAIAVLKNSKSVHITANNKENYFEWLSARHNKAIYRALYVLNVIERELRWKRTTVKKVVHNFSNKHDLYLFIASPKWMFSPPLLSLYTLIIRSGTFENISKIKSINELSIAYNKTTERHVSNVYSTSFQNTDIEFLKEISPHLEKFLVNINKIYKGRDQKMNFSKSILEPGHHTFTEGITKLVKGTTSDELVLERFLKYTRK